MIKQLSAIDCWAQGWVVIAVRSVTQRRWFKHWCCQLKLRVVLLDKALIVVVRVHPAGIGYRHLLGVNWCTHPEEVNDSHLLNTTETRNTYAPSWLGEKQRWNDISGYWLMFHSNSFDCVYRGVHFWFPYHNEKSWFRL